MMPIITSQETEAYAKAMRIQESNKAERGPGGLKEFEAQRRRYHNREMEYHGPIDMLLSWMDAHSVARMLDMDVVSQHKSGFNGSYRILKRDER